MVLSHVSEAEAVEINAEFANLAETFRVIHDPDDITVVRQGGTVIDTFTPLSIRQDRRQEATTGAGTPVAGTEQTGTLKLWAADVDAAPLRIGDRFLWRDQHCVIATPSKPRLGGIVTFGFTLEGRT